MKMSSGSRALDKIYKRRDRYEIPEWQRQEVWTQSKKQNLIDSILRGWKLPKFYFLKTGEEPEQFEVVDGQQRLASIFDFFDNELVLSPSSAERFGADGYEKLPDIFSDIFDDYEIEFDAIEDASDEDVREFFQRLQEGLPLTSSEKLNSIQSKLRDFAARLAKHPFFLNKVMASDKRYGHFDIVAKAAAVEIDGIDVGLRFDDLRAVFESQASFSDQSNVANKLEATLDFLDRTFDDASRYLRNRTVVQSLITLASRLIYSEKADGHEGAFARFVGKFMEELSNQVELGQQATDSDYLAFQRTVNANVRAGPKTRQGILLRKLLASEPSFSRLLDPTSIIESGLSAQIRKDAEAIIKLAGSINEEYSSRKGEDLFKPTNKTVSSQHALGQQLSSYEDYKGLINNLYFLFHEGTGKRLEGIIPTTFRDVNLLRTGLQHDVDHGPTSRVKKKKRNIASTFEKYSGSSSPETLAPEQFSIVQANLLVALRKDLEKLPWSTG